MPILAKTIADYIPSPMNQTPQCWDLVISSFIKNASWFLSSIKLENAAIEDWGWIIADILFKKKALEPDVL